MNDSKEFVAARESLLKFIRAELHKKFAAWKVNEDFDFEKGTNLGELAQHESEVIVESMYDVTYNRMGNPYVFSGFCCSPNHDAYKNGGLLNWAIYGQRGGYALRLNPHKLAKLLLDEASKFAMPLRTCAKVVYSTNEPSVALKEDYATIADVAKQMVEGSVKNDMRGVDVGRSAAPFSRVSSLLEDAYFRDEAEARIMLLRPHVKLDEADMHELKVRHRNGVTIPYIELFHETLFGDNSPIEAILIGPHSERERRRSGLEIYLKGHGLQSIEVIDSEVPYIG
jgi:hypothetical protein